MNRIAALSLTIASIVLMSAPADAIPWGKLSKEAVEHVPAKAAKEAAEEAVEHVPASSAGDIVDSADDAVKGLPSEVDPALSNSVGSGETPTQILQEGVEGTGLNPNDAIRGAQTPLEAAETALPPDPIAGNSAPEPSVGAALPAAGGAAVAIPLAAGGSSSETDSGPALPLVGGTALATIYGIYRVVKGRR